MPTAKVVIACSMTRGRVWGIDHGLCFHTDYKMRTVIWDWAEEPVPQAWLDDVERLATALEAGEEEFEALREFLVADEVDRIIERSRELLHSRAFSCSRPPTAATPGRSSDEGSTSRLEFRRGGFMGHHNDLRR